MEAFEYLTVWKRSSALAVKIYHSLKGCKDYSLRDQIIRSAISISSNIAGGFERNSNKQFAQYLQFAKGSCGELRSQLYICAETGLPDSGQAESFRKEAIEISQMIHGLIKRCRQNNKL
jgi:four helix bundle protein